MGYLAYMRANRPGWSRMHWRSRSRDASIDHFGAKHEAFDLPIPLLHTCASSYAFNNHSASTVSCRYCAPVRPFPRQIGDKGDSSRRMDVSVLRAPFPITEDTGLTSFSTCSLGHIDDPSFMPPLNGNPSQAMVRLMNSFRMKPGWIVWNGCLHVWVNSLCWKQLPDANDDFRYAIGGVPATLELELFKAYRVYYEQLRCELPYPYAGPVSWPDQCDPRFPLPSDPRYGAYT